MQFSTRDLLIWITVYAGLFALIQGMQLPALQIVAAVTIVTVFVLLSARRKNPDSSLMPAGARRAYFVSYYATALALAFAVCLAVDILIPPPPPAPPAPKPFFKGMLDLISGEVLEDFGASLARAIGHTLAYVIRFALLSLCGFIAALLAWRHTKPAKWLALANLPGTIVLVWALIAQLFE